jgi:glyoxylase-like metal-dependent hydrolase (beta-lactamase superfamily II)/DNA-directed RNA polymerase subunit RPC12/RpoP
VTAYICTTCGLQLPPSDDPPAACPICSDYRQFVPRGGQRWTTLEELRRDHRNAFQQLEPGLIAIATTPEFAIGERALLLRTPAGNVLWDCISLIDDATIEIIRGLGGLQAIAISHPHYYTTMVEWSRAFSVPVLVHEGDREWVVRQDAGVRFWTGETHDVLAGIRLVHCGGHFPGSAILHWAAGADGRGVLLTGDTIQVLPDNRQVSFMRSYPNMIPLPEAEVMRIARIVSALRFDRIYGAFWERDLTSDGRARVQESAERYVAWLNGRGTDAPVS